MSELARVLPAGWVSRHTEQFLLGAVVGAAASYLLCDEDLRNRLIKAAMKLYSGATTGLEELKEQLSDLKAEVEAERTPKQDG